MTGGIKRGSVKWLTLTAVLMAMNIVLSMSAFSLPVPGGKLYFCDAVINTAAILLDPFAAFLVGGLGSMIGDLLFYPVSMFVSLSAHGLQAALASFLSHRLFPAKPFWASLLGVTAGSVVMVAGYTAGKALLYSTLETALLKLPFECLQAFVGAVLAMTLCYPLRLKTLFHHLAAESFR